VLNEKEKGAKGETFEDEFLAPREDIGGR